SDCPMGYPNPSLRNYTSLCNCSDVLSDEYTESSLALTNPLMSIGRSNGHTRPSWDRLMKKIITTFSTVPLWTFQIFNSSISTTVASLHYEGPPRNIAPERIIAKSMGPSLTIHENC